MHRYCLVGAILALGVAPVSALPPGNEATLEHATEVLTDLAGINLKEIPPKLLADAQGVAIIPRVVKAGFVIGGRGGHGLVMAKGKDGVWGDPVFVNLGGASVGFQAGVESTDVVLVFRSRKSLDRLLEGKGKITLGADAAIAAGPVGRNAMAGTDAKLEAEILSYSRSRGLFAGVSFDGAVIRTDAHSTAMFRKSPEEMKAADVLKMKLVELSVEKRAPAAPILQPPVVVPPPPAVTPVPPPVVVPSAPFVPPQTLPVKP
jgi:lipid-binding SYLF domain-containing protein